jgi:hypothetical protein
MHRRMWRFVMLIAFWIWLRGHPRNFAEHYCWMALESRACAGCDRQTRTQGAEETVRPVTGVGASPRPSDHIFLQQPD